MANTDIFNIDNTDIDVKNYTKVRLKSCLNDTVILKFLVYSNNTPIDLTNFNVEFRAFLPQSKQLYSEVNNIVKNGNELTINCDSVMTSEIGEVISYLRIFNTSTQQKSSYQIVIKVMSTISADETIATQSTLSALNSLDLAINRYIELKVNLLDEISDAEIAISTLNTTITYANTTKNDLETSKTNADNAKIALENSIVDSNTKITNMTNKINEGNLLVTNLTAKNSEAQIAKVDLENEVILADQKIIDLQNFDPNSVVQNTNILLSEIYCKNELLSINHGLNGYPIVQLVYTEFGAGVGGAGNFPAGADSDCNLMQNRTVYTDNNNITIYVPDNYYIANPQINRISNVEYIVTFPSSTRSILIKIDTDTSESFDNIDGGSFIDIANYIVDGGTF